MLAARLSQLRLRLDSLQQGPARPGGVWGWALGLMVVTTLALIYYFRRRNWW